MKSTGVTMIVIGAALIGVAWFWGGVIGFLDSEVPILLVVCFAGLLLTGFGLTAYRGAAPATPTPGTEDVTPSEMQPAKPVGAPVMATAKVEPDASAYRLVALVRSNPELWSAIEVHPNTSPALRRWIAEQRRA